MPRCRQKVKILFAFVCFVFMLAKPVFADDFLTGTEDVPLMQDLTVLPEEMFDFDTEDGRLYSTKAVGSIDSAKVLDFYRQTLPQLGWKEKQAGVFVREGDELRINTNEEQSQKEKLTVVVFELVTKSK